MHINSKILGLLLVSIGFLMSCSKNDIATDNLKNYISTAPSHQKGGVIACAASKPTASEGTFIFFYPPPGASNIQYFESSTAQISKDDFGQYQKVALPQEPVFNGYLKRFVKGSAEDAWCVVTFEVLGVVYSSNPIRLKRQTKPTEWTTSAVIDTSIQGKPKFVWNDGSIKENTIYFQVVSSAQNDLITGTYTKDKWFQYYDTSNVVLNVTRTAPPVPLGSGNYQFTLMGVSEDNWVNLVIQKSFVIN